jgi:hypothetical protein
MTRRQIFRSHPWLLMPLARVAAQPPGKESTPSEVSELARALSAESLGGLSPIPQPNESQRKEQADNGERRSPEVE